ncbi:MAG: LuxR family transcriptional regulator [Candidatus Phaeomarinobacter sp.]
MFADYLERLGDAADENQEIRIWSEAMADMGFEKHMYGIRAQAAGGVGEHLVESTTFTEDWLGAYYGGLHENDPVVAHSIVHSMPFVWTDCPIETPEQHAFMSDAADAGLRHGISAPLIVGSGYEGAVSVSGDSNPDLQEHLMAIYAMTNAMHVLRVKNWSQDTLKAFKLTAREKEVMRWIAAGKDDWSIGCILGSSENGVRFHKKNIFRKLQLSSRVAVAAVAHKTGIAEVNYRFW